VQQQVAATNGIHVVKEIGKMGRLPIPDIPISTSLNSTSLLLDIRFGWGRWRVAASQKGYVTVKMDLRLEFCETARSIVAQAGIDSHQVVGD
jgi:hypothetical protein